MIHTDFLLNKDKGYWDISVSNDIDSTEGLDTSILTSIFTDSRASDSEQPVPLLRRGWWGDGYTRSSLGSKVWLTINRPITDETSNYISSYVSQALQWLIDDKFFTKIDVSTSVDIEKGVIYLYIMSTKNDIITKRIFEVLQET